MKVDPPRNKWFNRILVIVPSLSLGLYLIKIWKMCRKPDYLLKHCCCFFLFSLLWKHTYCSWSRNLMCVWKSFSDSALPVHSILYCMMYTVIFFCQTYTAQKGNIAPTPTSGKPCVDTHALRDDSVLTDHLLQTKYVVTPVKPTPGRLDVW